MLGNIRRSNFVVYRDILDAAKENIHSWRLAYMANLNTITIKHFMNDLLRSGFIECNDGYCHTTKEGLIFMSKVNNILRLIET